jgi:hypothetical protein
MKSSIGFSLGPAYPPLPMTRRVADGVANLRFSPLAETSNLAYVLT